MYESNNPSRVYSIGRNPSCSNATRHFRATIGSKLGMSLRCPTGKMTSTAKIMLRSRKTTVPPTLTQAAVGVSGPTPALPQHLPANSWEQESSKESWGPIKLTYKKILSTSNFCSLSKQCLRRHTGTQRCQRLWAVAERSVNLAGRPSHKLEVRGWI